jgi:hypothetical protein
MDAEGSAPPISKVAFQCLFDGAKGYFLPGNFVLSEQACLLGFVTRVELVAQESCSVVQVNLPNTNHIQHREQTFHFDLRARLLNRFAQRTICGGFTQFHEACRQSPLAMARLDVALAQKHPFTLFPPIRYGTNHIQRVFIMNGPARRANRTNLGVAVVWYAVFNGGAAIAAVFDGGTKHGAQFSGTE